jgi:hypothetical protein
MSAGLGITMSVTNPKEITVAMGKVIDNMVNAIINGLVDGMRDFEGHIISTMLSGRSNTSLGRVTGYAAESWKPSDPMYDGKNVIVRLTSRAKYLGVHQTGSKDWDGTFGGSGRRPGRQYSVKGPIQEGPRRHNIPKRLHVFEDYEQKGPDFFMKAINRRINKVGRA